MVSCIVFPSIFHDWDLTQTEDLLEYERSWKQVEYEHKVMSIWHCVINLVLTVPLLFNAGKGEF